jgi:hypothetical protein
MVITDKESLGTVTAKRSPGDMTIEHLVEPWGPWDRKGTEAGDV